LAKQDPKSGEVQSKSRGGDTLAVALMLAATCSAVAGFGYLFSIWWQARISDNYEILRIASQEFVAGRPIVAGDLAETVELEPIDDAAADADADADESESLGPDEQAAEQTRAQWNQLRSFLIGAGKVARAGVEEETRAKRRIYHEAIPYLETSREGGFPAGREVQGNRILGETLFRVGRFDEATDALQAAVDRDPRLARELLPILAKAQLNSLQPTTEQSLSNIQRFLAQPTLDDSQRREGELIRIEALIDLQRWQEAKSVIETQLAPYRSTELRLADEEVTYRDRLRLLQAILRIEQATRRFDIPTSDRYENRGAITTFLGDTITELEELQREADMQTATRARLWSARAYLLLGLQEEALTQLDAVRQQRPFGAEGVVGGLEQIELLAGQGRGIEMLQATRYVMRELGDARGYDGGLIPFDEFRRRLRNAIDQLRRRGAYEHAIDAARSLPPVFARSEALMQEGLGYQEWAQATIADGTDIGGEVARSASKLARSRYRAAGDAFAEAAKIEFSTTQYVPTLWSAIVAYQEGRHFSHCIELLESYLRHESRQRRPRGLVALGRALLAVGEADRAIDALTNCVVEFPRDPLRYDARLLAALAHADLGDLDNARKLLIDNLQDGELTPQSPAWRDSLLTLGELLYQRGYENHLLAERKNGAERLELLRANQPILEEAIRRLDEAVTRYWDTTPRAESAAYLASRTHVLAAEWPRMEAQLPDILDAAKRTLHAREKFELETALDGFNSLRKHLARREEEHRLPEKEQAMLRNCFLAEADTLREMSRFEEAADTYRAVSLRYMNEPPALEAILGQARCAKDLGRDQEANLLIRRANVVLQRIPNEWNGKFEETTRFDRNGWEKLLTWMSSRLDTTAGGV
jgi:tetratricopeptide (TPR) repeat protein